MRIIHLSDTHLGYRQFSGKLDPSRGLNQRECDVYNAWHIAIDITIERSPDLVIHAGDVFDSWRPAPRAIAEALDGFNRLREAGIPTIVISGNHSTPRFRSGGSIFEILERFGIEAVWREPRTLHVKGFAIHAVPHEPEASQLLSDIRSLKPDSKSDGNILVLHAGLEGLRQSYGEVNEISIDPEVLATVEYDYIALGHMHRFQVPQINAAYPGSLERLDFGDIDGEKAVLEVDLVSGPGSPGFLTRHAVSARAMFDLSIDCKGLDPREVLGSAEREIADKNLEGAIVRLRLEGINRDVYHSLDFRAVDELLTSCLHRVVLLGRGGLAIPRDSVSPDSFTAFARREIPQDIDAEHILALAQRYLDDAAAQEVEEAWE